MASRLTIGSLLVACFAIFSFALTSFGADAATVNLSPGSIEFELGDPGESRDQVALALRILLLFTVLSLAPSILIAMTSFVRIIVVLSMLRFAFGMQQTPPNLVLISLALLLTVFNMRGVFNDAFENGLQPFLDGQMEAQQAVNSTLGPFRQFMVKQTRSKDLLLMIELSKEEKPSQLDDVDTLVLVPAYMLSELKTAFQIGFVIFLPFLLIDIVVASILMSMGMLMVPPMMISLPIKVLMFVLIDGWHLVVESLMASF